MLIEVKCHKTILGTEKQVFISVCRPEKYEAIVDFDGNGERFATIEELAELGGDSLYLPVMARETFINGLPGWHPGFEKGELKLFQSSSKGVKFPTVTILR